MRHGSLFSGLGGFDLAAEWMGWENVFHCEWMEFPRKVLEYHFPNSDSLIDICKTDFKKYEGTIDIITGGFPCQPFSTAGKRKGTNDERYLWGEMLRAIQEIKPQYVIAENVFGITNIDGGLVFEQVCLDLEAEGYEVQPFIIPAASKNAPHRRDRVWFVGVRDATDSHLDGFNEGREYDGIGKVTNGSNAQSKWSTNTKDINRCGADGIFEKQSRIGSRVSEQANVEKNQTTTSRRVCGMDSPNYTKGISRENWVVIDKSRALVQKGQSRFFSSINRGLANNKTSFGQLANLGLSIDISRINSMEWNATNPNSNGFNKRNSNDEINASKGWLDAQRNTNTDDVNGDVTDTSSRGIQRHWRRSENGKFQTNEFNTDNRKRQPRMDWDKFPTQSPICGGDDGLPTKLDGITFSKWRAESIKGYGNAIVPQVAYEIFKAIEKL